MWLTLVHGADVVSGLYVPRSKIEVVKALFGKADQQELFMGRDAPGRRGMIPDEILDKLPPKLGVLGHEPDGHARRRCATPSTTPGRSWSRASRSTSTSSASCTWPSRWASSTVLKTAALGYYWKRINRLRTANDITTTAHETGHYLADLFNNLNPPTTFDYELLALGRQTSRPSYTKVMVRREGEAEFFRLYLMDRATAQAHGAGLLRLLREADRHPAADQAGRRGAVRLLPAVHGTGPGSDAGGADRHGRRARPHAAQPPRHWDQAATSAGSTPTSSMTCTRWTSCAASWPGRMT